MPKVSASVTPTTKAIMLTPRDNAAIHDTKPMVTYRGMDQKDAS